MAPGKGLEPLRAQRPTGLLALNGLSPIHRTHRSRGQRDNHSATPAPLRTSVLPLLALSSREQTRKLCCGLTQNHSSLTLFLCCVHPTSSFPHPYGPMSDGKSHCFFFSLLRASQSLKILTASFAIRIAVCSPAPLLNSFVHLLANTAHTEAALNPRRLAKV